MILITGSSGLLGRYITEKFSVEGHEVVATYNKNRPDKDYLSNPANVTYEQCCLSDYDKLSELIKKADYVIHAAALVSFNPGKKDKMFYTNVKGTENIVNICLKQGNKPLMYVSSVAALGRNKNTSVIDENNKWEDSSLNSNYAVSKYLAEQEVWRGSMEGLPVTIVNPSTVLGVSETDTSSMQFVKMLKDGSVFYPGGMMNWVDVRDVAEKIYQLFEKKITDQRFILNAGSATYQHLFKEASLISGQSSPKIKVGKPVLSVASFFDMIKSAITGSDRVVTSETIRISGAKIEYSSEKIKQTLKSDFRSLQETLKWILTVDQK
ncbi:NAD-dependent epimerase/dehydratase family protein [Marinigracilibium pacificum]|uniref:NAD-dependent epimerase/dehydratase family protein n=1 Tax=Marinigracilibium pacificum TaxID=2729599 RepID=A0A848IW38_9BACT|nr:NAD-dependent epimerase/dehydratase family protein [Marinigracilibium pacificum]NMM47388.1 NAD-dependent epimerase/dehydratase family protein [Marinigracilibium pacificum]